MGGIVKINLVHSKKPVWTRRMRLYFLDLYRRHREGLSNRLGLFLYAVNGFFLALFLGFSNWWAWPVGFGGAALFHMILFAFWPSNKGRLFLKKKVLRWRVLKERESLQSAIEGLRGRLPSLPDSYRLMVLQTDSLSDLRSAVIRLTEEGADPSLLKHLRIDIQNIERSREKIRLLCERDRSLLTRQELEEMAEEDMRSSSPRLQR